MKFAEILTFLLFGLFITSCRHTGDSNPEIDAPKELKSCLVNTAMFEHGWEWQDSGINFTEFPPDINNDYLTSITTSYIRGLSKSKSPRFDIVTGLATYEKPIQTKPKIANNLKSPSYIDFHPNFPPVKGKLDYFCSVGFYDKQYHSYGCQIQLVYHQHILNITHWGSTFISSKNIEDFINPYLIQFDNCIFNLDK